LNGIAVIIPTLSKQRGEATGTMALAAKGHCEAVLIVSHDPERTGFSKTCNRGIRQAHEEADICLLNDDITWFQHGWLATLQRALYKSPNYALAVPSGKSSTNPMRLGRLGMRGIKVVNHVPFWCVVIKRKTIDTLGLLDERFIHYASDSWYCDQVKRIGLKSIWVRDVYLEHRKHGSKLIGKWRKRDQALYRRWKRKGR
jgi:GT2 family glycosyltransferase